MILTIYIFISYRSCIMPGKPRTLSSTGIYHIILRAVNQHIIFEEDSDFQKFLFIFQIVKRNMCRYASEYRWSSINAYLGAKNPLINASFAYNIAGSKDSLLHYFAKEADSPDNSLFKNDHREVNHFFTDEKALDIFKSITHLTSTADVINLEKVKRNEYVRMLKKEGLTIKQIARVMDISGTTVKRICQKNLSNGPLTPSPRTIP